MLGIERATRATCNTRLSTPTHTIPVPPIDHNIKSTMLDIERTARATCNTRLSTPTHTIPVPPIDHNIKSTMLDIERTARTTCNTRLSAPMHTIPVLTDRSQHQKHYAWHRENCTCNVQHSTLCTNAHDPGTHRSITTSKARCLTSRDLHVQRATLDSLHQCTQRWHSLDNHYIDNPSSTRQPNKPTEPKTEQPIKHPISSSDPSEHTRTHRNTSTLSSTLLG